MENRAEDGDGAAARKRITDRVTGPLDALHIIAEDDAEKADAALEGLLDADTVEDQVLDEMTDPRPLADPERFAAAHRSVIRALEVYDRNARLAPTRLGAGPLTPVVRPVIGLLVGAISDRFLRRIVDEVRRLYLLREGASPVGGREHRLLTTARRQMTGSRPSSPDPD